MKKALFIIGLSAIFMASCQNGAMQEREKQLQDSFASVMSAKNAELEAFFQQLNEIETSLNEITSAYSDVVENVSANGETSKDAVAGIKAKISNLGDILAADKAKLKSLNNQVYRLNNQNKELQNFVANLEARIAEQESQIQTLTKELEKKNATIKSLEKDVAGLKEADKKKNKQIAEIQDEQHTAYFAIGTKKELRAKNLVDRKGGFIGLGKSTVLANNSDFAAFTKIDTRNTQEIPLTGQKVKIVTPHPETSYSLEGDPKRPTSIRIVNPDLFWKASKCLVIMVN
ncbi:MAG: hypothetical protein J6U84_06600 [Bacteroidales bacterium]|nr:hypothetical protein [Bacteroidales bacterium]